MKTIGVIPSYNTDSSLVEAVDSLEKNGVEKIVIVNDGSSNQNSLNILSYFRKHRNIEIIDTENYGLPAARNTGIDFAINQYQKDKDFKYIVFLDSDDYFVDNSIQHMKECLEKNQEKVYAYPVIEEFYLGRQQTHELDFFLFPHLFRNRLPYSCLYKIETFSTGLRYRKSMKFPNWSEDYDFSMQVLNDGWIPIKVPEAILKYRVRRESMAKYVAKHWLQIKDEIVERNEIFKDFDRIESERQVFINSAKYEKTIQVSFLKKLKVKSLKKFELFVENIFIKIRMILKFCTLGLHSYSISGKVSKIGLSKDEIRKKLFFFENNDYNLISNFTFNLAFWESQTKEEIIIIDTSLRSIFSENIYVNEFGKQKSMSFNKVLKRSLDNQGLYLHRYPQKAQKEKIKMIVLLFLILSGSRIVIKNGDKSILDQLIEKSYDTKMDKGEEKEVLAGHFEIYLEPGLKTDANF